MTYDATATNGTGSLIRLYTRAPCLISNTVGLQSASKRLVVALWNVPSGDNLL